MDQVHIQSAIGVLKVSGNEHGISSVSFLNEAIPVSQDIPKELQKAVEQLGEYLSGSRTEFTLKINPPGTDFQKKVWKKLQAIPYGKTMTYQEIANELGDPKVIRAAASANGKNPIAIIVPCHRVIGSDGSLTGYAGGLSRKQWLLEHESGFKQGKLF